MEEDYGFNNLLRYNKEFENNEKMFLKMINLKDLPRTAIEYELIEELLYLSVGIGGSYIRCSDEEEEGTLKRRGRTITIDESVPIEYKGLIIKILPVFLSYVEICDYIDKYSNYESGLVCQSFCSGLNSIKKEYLVAISQIEEMKKEGKVTLQTIFFLLDPLSYTLGKMSDLCDEASEKNLKGASLINLLNQYYMHMKSDKQCHSILYFLMSKTMVPYYEMLESWIFNGVLEDPYDEFMVKENWQNLTGNKDSFWSSKYYITEKEDIPTFLRDYSSSILLAGKYLNIVREYNPSFFVNKKNREQMKFKFGQEQKNFFVYALKFANDSILHLFLEEKNLVDKIREVCSTFMLLSSDFISYFIDSSIEGLFKNDLDSRKEDLQSALQLSLRSSVLEGNSINENVCFVFLNNTLFEQLKKMVKKKEDEFSSNSFFLDTNTKFDQMMNPSQKMYESIALSYKSEWPLNIIINESSEIKYQTLFRHLFKCKFAHYNLSSNCWMKLKKTKSLLLTQNTPFSSIFNVTNVLCNQMLKFLENLLKFYSQQILVPKLNELSHKIEISKSIEDVLSLHNQFLDDSLEGCLIVNNQDLVLCLQNILNFFIDFSLLVSTVIEKSPFDKLALLRNQPNCRQNKKEDISEQINLIHNVISQTKFVEIINKYNYLWKDLSQNFKKLIEENILKSNTRNDFSKTINFLLMDL